MVKILQKKESLQYHTKNNVCTGTYHDDDGKSFACKYCGKGVTLSSSMYRHMNHTCKIKKADDQERDEIYERLVKLEERNDKFEEENKKLKREVVSLRKNVKSVKTITKILITVLWLISI